MTEFYYITLIPLAIYGAVCLAYKFGEAISEPAKPDLDQDGFRHIPNNWWNKGAFVETYECNNCKKIGELYDIKVKKYKDICKWCGLPTVGDAKLRKFNGVEWITPKKREDGGE